jgi:hypothetical protein
MNDRALVGLCAAALLVIMIAGGAMVLNGLAIGLLTSVAFLVLALKKKWVRDFARRYPFLADAAATAISYGIFPPGVTAFVGSGVVALVITMIIAMDRVINPHLAYEAQLEETPQRVPINDIPPM